MSRLKRHFAKPVKVELENANGEKDAIMIKPLPFDYMPEFYEFVKYLSKTGVKDLPKDASEKEIEEQSIEVMQKLPKDAFLLLKDLLLAVMKDSLPDEKIEDVKEFLSNKKNEALIMNAMIEASDYESKEQG